MPVGNVSLTVQDGALGIAPPPVGALTCTLGACSLGTAATLYSFSSPDDLITTLGTGPGVEAAAYKLAQPGVGQVYVMPVNTSVAGVSSSVTPTRVATSTSVMSVTGTPLDAYSVVVKVVTAGTGQLVTSGAIGIQISLDGGTTFGQIVAIPAGGTYVVSGTGLSLVFTTAAAANLDFGDKFTFTSQAPFYSTGDLNSAFTALGLDGRLWGLAHVVGYPTAGNSATNATSGASFATAIATNMAAFANTFRYARAICEAPASLDADLISSYASFADPRVMVVAGQTTLVSPLTGRIMTRHQSWATMGRLAAIRASQSPGLVGNAPGLAGAPVGGPLLGVKSLVRDERKTPGLYDARFSVGLTYLGVPGFFCDLGRVMAALGSDYSNIMNGRVMDAACAAARTALMQYLNAAVRVNANGTIYEVDARSIEKYVEAAVRAAVVQPGDATDCNVTTNRTDNILSTQLLRVKVRVTPFGYASSISGDIGFNNPSLVLAAS